MSVIVTGMEMPKNCIYTQNEEICNCPLLDENDCCKGQSEYNNQHCDDWEDLRKNCPLKSVDGLIEQITQLHTIESNDGQDYYQAYDVLRVIKEYCGMEVDDGEI